MTDKISFGIKVYGIISIIFSLIVLFLIVIPDVLYMPSLALAYFVTSMGWLIFGFGVLRRFSGARIGLMVLCVIYIVDIFEQPARLLSTLRSQPIVGITVLIISLIYFLSLIFFFTRPSVKREFKKNSETDL